jgi:hypothetical protein
MVRLVIKMKITLQDAVGPSIILLNVITPGDVLSVAKHFKVSWAIVA